jgi:hypothetical protein
VCGAGNSVQNGVVDRTDTFLVLAWVLVTLRQQRVSRECFLEDKVKLNSGFIVRAFVLKTSCVQRDAPRLKSTVTFVTGEAIS